MATIQELAKEFGIEPDRVEEMDKAISTHQQLFSDFTWADGLNYINTMLADKFTEKERSFMIFMYGLSLGVKITKNKTKF